MAYSTGTGSGEDFLNAIRAFAVSKGWTEFNGVGTGFPIVKDGLFVSMSSFSVGNITDVTQLTSVVRNPLLGSMGIGQNAATAVTNRDSAPNRIKLFEFSYGVGEWHLFSDVAGSYVHWAFRFSNLYYPEVWSHGGFGFLDKEGMSHGGVGYATSSDIPSYVTSTGASQKESSITVCGGMPWGGAFFNVVSNPVIGRKASTQYLLFSPGFTIPATTFPQPGVVFVLGQRLTLSSNFSNQNLNYNGTINQGITLNTTSGGTSLPWIGFAGSNNPYLGATALAPLPFIVMPSTNSVQSELGIYAGSYPGIRSCNITNFVTGAEVSYAGETWKLFPIFRKTNNSVISNNNREFTSGNFGFAHRRINE